MKKITSILMDYGFDFEYENRGSDGEKILALGLGLEISNQNGKIYFSCMSAPEIFEENEHEYIRLSKVVEQECINETTSF